MVIKVMIVEEEEEDIEEEEEVIEVDMEEAIKSIEKLNVLIISGFSKSKFTFIAFFICPFIKLGFIISIQFLLSEEDKREDLDDNF